LFPVELTADYPTLTPSAKQIFDRRDVEIVMLHVIEEPTRAMRGLEVARSMAQLEFLARKEFALARTAQRVERGRTADCILEYARNSRIDAIILPVNCPEGLRRELAAKTPCTLWIDWRAEPAPETRQVCCAVMLESSDAAVLCRAAQAAEELGAELTILHAVVPESPMNLWWDTDAVAQETRVARTLVEDLRDQFAPAARVHVEAGRVDWVVNQALHRLNAGLLVAAEHREAITAATMTCPVLRIGMRQPEAAREAQPSRAILAATA
jgi:nucleotide-binding universal stress UspA family protein